MKKKRMNLLVGVIAVLAFVACSQVTSAQNIVKVDLDGKESLEALLGKDIYEVDSLVVSGKLTDEDFKAMRMASRYGQLTGVNIKDVLLENNELPRNAFWGMDEYVNDFDESVNDFMGNVNFKYITVPDNLESFGYAAFYGCKDLKYVNIPVTLKKFDESLFSDCYEIFKGQCVEIPAEVTVIPSWCFDSCEGIAEVKFPDGLKRIENRAFANCNFDNLILTENLEYIGHDAFVCVKHESDGNDIRTNAIKGDIYCKAVNPPVCDDDNRDRWPFVADGNKTVYVPVGSAEAYRNAPGWNQFTKFVELEEFPTTGLTEVAMPNVDAAVYDMQGNRVTTPVKGQIYISEGKKFVAR